MSQTLDCYVSFSRMADVNKLVFSIIRFLQDQKTNNALDEEKVESIEGKIFFLFNFLTPDGASSLINVNI